MKLIIEIPEDFRWHYNYDKFKDSLNRLRIDCHLMAGRIEKELAIMLIKSFENSIEVEEIKLENGDKYDRERQDQEDCYNDNRTE